MIRSSEESFTDSDEYEVQSEPEVLCVSPVGDYKHNNKRKLEGEFECVLIESNIESPDTLADDNVGHPKVQLKRQLVDLKVEEIISVGESEDEEINPVMLDSRMVESETPLEDFDVSGTSSTVDPLLAECDIITPKQNLEELACITHETDSDDDKHSSLEPSLQQRQSIFVRKNLTYTTEDAGSSSVLQTNNPIEQNVSEVANMRNHNNCDLSSKNNMVGINTVDNLLRKNFSSFTFEEQLKIKTLGPHQPRDIQIHQTDKTQNRFFSEKWFDKVEWLTVSETTKRFFCFYCLLFGGESIWCKTGYTNIKHLSEKIKFHAGSSLHLNNTVKYKTFGNTSITSQVHTDSQTEILRHKEVVDRNRYILGRILDCIKFCATHNLPQSDECIFNRKAFLGLVSEITNTDSAVCEHFHNLTTPSYISETVQNELLDCMYHVYQEDLKKDIEKANFISLQVEKIPDVSCKSHFAVILRYMKDGIAAERLYSFIEVPDQSAAALADALKEQLIPLEVRCKLVAQTYDGTVTMRGPFGGVQKHMKEFFPHALFVHSYAHSLGMIIRQACSTIPRIRIFFTNIYKISKFFLLPSKRTRLLHLQSKKFPGIIESKWNSESEIIKTVYHNQLALLACFGIIREETGWDDESIWEASHLADMLEDKEFFFFICFFNTVLDHVVILHRSFQARKSCGDIMSDLQEFETNIADMMEVIGENTKNPDAEFKAAANEACGIIISELRERFVATDHLITFSIIDPKQFRNMSKFPHDHLQVLACKYHMLIPGKLTSELKVVYSNETFAAVTSECALLNLLAENELRETFSELCKLIEIALAVSVVSSHTESWVSTSEKLKNFMKPNMAPERLNVLTTLMIHRDVIDNMPDFNSRVIEYFATKGIGKPQLLYKT